ncbi:TetR/AcrR family transcriptional regulator [Paenibacillus sp. LPE1-1-1.1]|uniref:TetR/AcrR family transcriptional regulator n=1 Tax=Paenibacillus sp. LPE1-1-1.1 TaxID=3135230 RepID=UPI0034120F8B
MNNRRQLLLDTALTLMTEQGYANTTIQMILDESGVSKGTYYKFFNSKNDCIVAILEQQLQEDLIIRKDLENNDYASDFDLLVDQIAVPMTFPEKQRLMELFWTGLYSGEFDTANLTRRQLKWLSERLIQLYGEEIRPYAYEGAILCYGMLHQIANTRRNFHESQPVWKEVVPKVLNYVEVLLKTMQERHEHIIDFHTLSLIGSNENMKILDKKTLIDELQEFNRTVQKSKEPTQTKEITKGLLSLLKEDELNAAMLEVVLRAFQKQMESNGFHLEARRIAKDCWWHLEQIKDK